MRIAKFLDDLAIISKLGDNPGTDNGLTANGLKAKFDEAALIIQNFINSLIDFLNTELAHDGPIYGAVTDANNAANSANTAATNATSATVAATEATALAMAAVKYTIGYDENGLYIVTD